MLRVKTRNEGGVRGVFVGSGLGVVMRGRDAGGGRASGPNPLGLGTPCSAPAAVRRTGVHSCLPTIHRQNAARDVDDAIGAAGGVRVDGDRSPLRPCRRPRHRLSQRDASDGRHRRARLHRPGASGAAHISPTEPRPTAVAPTRYSHPTRARRSTCKRPRPAARRAPSR
jgi:hypothetical protein